MVSDPRQDIRISIPWLATGEVQIGVVYDDVRDEVIVNALPDGAIEPISFICRAELASGTSKQDLADAVASGALAYRAVSDFSGFSAASISATNAILFDRADAASGAVTTIAAAYPPDAAGAGGGVGLGAIIFERRIEGPIVLRIEETAAGGTRLVVESVVL